jgi:hypothetical protein
VIPDRLPGSASLVQGWCDDSDSETVIMNRRRATVPEPVGAIQESHSPARTASVAQTTTQVIASLAGIGAASGADRTHLRVLADETRRGDLSEGARGVSSMRRLEIRSFRLPKTSGSRARADDALRHEMERRSRDWLRGGAPMPPGCSPVHGLTAVLPRSIAPDIAICSATGL